MSFDDLGISKSGPSDRRKLAATPEHESLLQIDRR
jgi:hypothetical protein